MHAAGSRIQIAVKYFNLSRYRLDEKLKTALRRRNKDCFVFRLSKIVNVRGVVQSVRSSVPWIQLAIEYGTSERWTKLLFIHNWY